MEHGDRTAFRTRAAQQREEIDEIGDYVSARIVSSNSAVNALQGLSLVELYPTVIMLAIHLKDQQPVYYKESDERTAEQVAEAARGTTLTAYFKAQESGGTKGLGGVCASTLMYHEMPTAFLYEGTTQTWKPRSQASDTLGRVFEVRAQQCELYYLRAILFCKPFASFETAKGGFGSYEEHARALGLLMDNEVFINTLNDCVHFGSQVVRETFACLAYYAQAEVRVLWTKFKESMARDFCAQRCPLVHPAHRQVDASDINLALKEIERLLQAMSNGQMRNLTQFGVLAYSPVQEALDRQRNHLPTENISIRLQADTELFAQMQQQMNPDQLNILMTWKEALDNLCAAENSEQLYDGPRVFALKAAAGSGKTFIIKAILCYARTLGIKTKVCALSALAASQFPGGATFHSTFKAPLDPLALNASCKLFKGSTFSQELVATRMFCIDEMFMLHSTLVDLVDDAMRDVTGAQRVFGGRCIVIFSGDPRQLLAVIKGGGVQAQIQALVTNSVVFDNNTVNQVLVRNMRVESMAKRAAEQIAAGNLSPSEADTLQTQVNEAAVFSSFVLSVGEMSTPFPAQTVAANDILLPERIVFRREKPQANESRLALQQREDRDIRRFVHEIFGGAAEFCLPKNHNLPPEGFESMSQRCTRFFSERGIFTPLVRDTQLINDVATEIFLGEHVNDPLYVHTYFSSDVAVNVERGGSPPNISVEALNKICGNGLPFHRLRLAVNMVIILLRNISAHIGMLNGTQLIVQSLRPNLILARIITEGAFFGRVVGIPRMSVIAEGGALRLPFNVHRFQFPVIVSFCATVNKCQGLTKPVTYGYLPNPVFSIGQFYTLITRTGAFKGLRLFLGESSGNGYSDLDKAFVTQNVVLKSNFTLSLEPIRRQRQAQYPSTRVLPANRWAVIETPT